LLYNKFKIESEKVIKKNMIAFKMPRFITKESKFSFPALIKSLIDNTRKIIAAMNITSLITIKGTELMGEKKSFNTKRAAEKISSN
jgi:hypothetical protein